MKMKFGTAFIAMISMSLFADQAMPPATAPGQTSAPPARPAVEAPAKTPPKTTTTRRRAARPKPPEPRTVPLVAGPATVSVGRGPVNVRARAGLIGEVITKVTNGEPVSVLEEITLRNSGPDEPSAWAKIVLPSSAHGWVNSAYIDPTNNTVKVRTKLRVRGGPGENYSVIGELQSGDAIKEVSRKDAWIQIEPPANAYAFVAAQYLKQGPPGETPVTEPPPMVASVPESPVVSPTTETPTIPPATETPAVTPPTEPPAEPAIPPVDEPPPPRVVQREGLVRGTFSIQAPTKYELISVETKRPINYLYTTSRNLDLSRYKGLRIIVTGEEGLDERWRNTPVITIRRIQVIE